MPTYPHIDKYYEDKQRLIDYGGSDSEQNIRAAFQTCLASYCRAHRENFELVPELRAPGNVIPDGTVVDSLRQIRGHWEAKDLRDNLDSEIQRKFNGGYPRYNIIFEDSLTAVLFQNREETMRADMSRPADLHRLINRFLDYQRPEIQEFHQAQQQFKADLRNVIGSLRESVEAAEAGNPDYRAAAADFLAVCQRSISPVVTDDDVREMLLQHILTQDIFKRVVNEPQFRLHSANNIAHRLSDLERTFFTDEAHLQALTRLQSYYGAIGRAADEIADYAEKQKFLKAIYEDFYRAYNPLAADRLGVVYTPNEVVDFIIRGADYLLLKHFGKTLADDDVQILDPATGTGTFVTSLIDYLPLDRLEHKYLNEIYANEVAILPYHIANLNIEYSFTERTGRYLEFLNLCFVDTLDNIDGLQSGATGGAVTRQPTLPDFAALSEDNLKRVQLQNKQPITIIIGNPPYNANQQNENDNNKNREYQEIDRRISETYVKESTAQKTKQYDMYKRFLRWASDRLADDGIVAFVSNSAFLDSRQDDGFRKVVADEFNELWAIDLKGNARTSGERRRKEGGNVFDNKIRVGVAVYFLVRKQGQTGFKVFYNAVDDYARSHEKIEYIKDKSLASFHFSEITPNADGQWLNQSKSNFATLLRLADRQTKLAKTAGEEEAVFGLYSMGVVTNRDEWVYDFDADDLGRKVRTFINLYEESRAEHGGKDVDNDTLGTTIKWTRDLKRQLRLDTPNVFDRGSIRQTLFRPFVGRSLYFNQSLNEMQYQLPDVFPKGTANENKAICFCVNGKAFYVLAADRVFDLHFTGDTQCFPLYRYTPEGQRVSNITEWGLRQFHEHYGGDGITAEDIFAYTYAVLHDPEYREKYAVDLLREFPRLPRHDDFPAWKRKGQELLDLHIGFESADPFPLERRDVGASLVGAQDGNAPTPKPLLRADKDNGRIILDASTTLTGIPESAWSYRLGSRSALEWVLDQYKEKKPRDKTVPKEFNSYKFADQKERVIDLLQRVCTVSVETVRIVDSLSLLSAAESG